MAEQTSKDSKTEDATSKQLSDSRDKGRTAKSAEVSTFVIILASLIYFGYFGMVFVDSILELWTVLFTESANYKLTIDSVVFLYSATGTKMGLILLPPLLTIMVGGVASNILQNEGWIFSFDPLAPKFNKLNPLSGIKKIIGREGVMNLAKSLVKIGVVGLAAYYALASEWEKVPSLMTLPLAQSLTMIGDQVFWLVVYTLVAMFIIGIVDLVYQRWSYKDNLKMTKQEVKDERKQQEGDPQIKGRIKQRQFDMFRQRMMSSVPEAEVIITNPTHLSIALRYDRTRDAAPVVVAKGAGNVALKIREIAKENDITIVEDKPLAQTLFKNSDIGDVIPESLYKSVADILAYVYRINMKAI